ncbi:ABC transporter permease [Natronoglycomyces albus]|uniref:ABC transporter permease n=1 Tax=Natronoglycomyces albus TaxID=2811108 RepID=A0A895XW18_9ACTN|nr:ABC transporter permease [Natronoglycomyces albus]QSB05828.1 ABC transporter permease [Natronoglycomyces albus]
MSTTTETGHDPKSPGTDDKRDGFVTVFGRYLATANTFMVTVYSLLLALVIGGLLIIISDPHVRGTWTYFFSRPQDAFSASWDAVSTTYANLFNASIINVNTVGAWLSGETTFGRVLNPISETLFYATPLILTGLAVALAFRAGLFNIGAEGQAIMGAIAATVVGVSLGLPFYLHLPIALLAGTIAGGLYGAVPGILKARTGAHEVIVTIMMNFIALHFLLWALGTTVLDNPDRTEAISKTVETSAQLPPLLSFLGSHLRVHLGLFVALAAAVVTWWLLSRSTFGFRIRAVGANADASAVAGISVARTYGSSMGVSGALAGLGGAVILLGMNPYYLTDDRIMNIGFDGITVALLARANPYGVVAAAFLFGALRAGTQAMQPAIPIDMATLLQAIIVLFIAAPALVKATLHLKTPRGGLTTLSAKGW